MEIRLDRLSEERTGGLILSLIDTAFTSFIAFLVVLDPPGTAMVFVALTRAMPPAKRQSSARNASLMAALASAASGGAGGAGAARVRLQRGGTRNTKSR